MHIIVGRFRTQSDTEENAMHEFIAKYCEQIRGAVSGFDHLVFRGTLRAFRFAEGMKAYLIRMGIRVGALPSMCRR
jgi:hypothetical protein